MDPERQEEMNKKLMAVIKQRPEYQKKAMDLYEIKLVDGEKRSGDLIMREAYLDFYTKSMQSSN